VANCVFNIRNLMESDVSRIPLIGYISLVIDTMLVSRNSAESRKQSFTLMAEHLWE